MWQCHTVCKQANTFTTFLQTSYSTGKLILTAYNLVKSILPWLSFVVDIKDVEFKNIYQYAAVHCIISTFGKLN